MHRNFTAAALAAGLGACLAVFSAAAVPGARAEEQLAQATQRQAADQRYIEVCNRTGRVLNVATAQPAGERNSAGQALFISRGWHVMQPGSCKRVFGPGLEFRYYYVMGEGYSGNRSSGTFPFCIRKEAFTIKDVQCGDGYNRGNFSQIDTSGGKSITYSFTE